MYPMRMSRFWELMEDEFGAGYAHVLADSLVLKDYDGTAQAALDEGVDPKLIWREICLIQEVPEERWFGVEKPSKK